LLVFSIKLIQWWGILASARLCILAFADSDLVLNVISEELVLIYNCCSVGSPSQTLSQQRKPKAGTLTFHEEPIVFAVQGAQFGYQFFMQDLEMKQRCFGSTIPLTEACFGRELMVMALTTR